MKQEKEYFAFISYKREDERWAKWLADKLDNYKLPSTLNGKQLPQSLRKTFRDVDELSAGNLPEQIYKALSMSDNLIVVCSPRVAKKKSEWVNKEIEDFIKIKGGKSDNIFPFIIEGEPFSMDEERECFPDALRNLKDSEERLGGNINEQGGREAAVVKVVSGMLNVSFDSLWHKYEREQKKRRMWLTAIGIFAFIVVLGIATWMYILRQETLRANWSMMENQTRFVTEKVNEEMKEGDLLLAQLLLLEVLPKDLLNPDRPYIADAEAALRKAYNENNYVLCKHNFLTGTIGHNGHVMTIDHGKGINIWDEISGNLIRNFNERDVYYATYSPNQNEIAILYGDGGSSSLSPERYKEIHILDSNNGKHNRILKGHTAEVTNVIFSNDGKYLASTSYDGTIRLWDIANGKNIRIISGDSVLCKSKTSYESHIQVSHSLGFSPDGRHIVSCFGDRGIEVWNAENGDRIGTLKGHIGYAWGIKYSPDGNLLATAGDDKIVRIWDTKNYALLKSLDGHTGTIVDVSFSADSKYIVSSSNDSTIRVWDLEKGICIKKQKYHKGIMKALFNFEGNKIVFSSYDRSVRIWELENIPSYLTTPIVEYVSSPMSNIAFISNNEGETVWDVINKKFLFALNNNLRVDGIDYSETGNFILTMSSYQDDRSRIRVWDAKTGRFVVEFPIKGVRSYGSGLKQTVFSPDGKHIATAEKDSTIRIFDISTGKCVKSIKKNTYERIKYTPDGSMLVVAPSWVNKFYLLRIEDEEIVHSFTDLRGSVSCFLFGDEKTLITANGDEKIMFWDIASGQCVKTINLNMGNIEMMSLSKDGKFIICVCDRKYINIVDINNGVCLNTFESDRVVYAAMREDNRTIISATSDGLIQYWDYIPLQELIDKLRRRFKNRQLTPEERKRFYLE